MRRLMTAVVFMVLAESLAAAQGPGRPACKDGEMQFAATAANRLMGAQLQQAVAGKRLGYLRESIRTPGVWVNNQRELRADGSMVYTCEYARSADGPWRPCTSIGSMERRAAGSRDVGVWSIKNNAVCATKSAFGEATEDCMAIHRQGAVFAARRISGPPSACVQGTITLQ